MSTKLPDVPGDALRFTPYHANAPLSYGVTVSNVRVASPKNTPTNRSIVGSAVGHELESSASDVDQAWELAACEAVAAAELAFSANEMAACEGVAALTAAEELASAARQNVQDEEFTQEDTIGFPSDDDSDDVLSEAPATTTDVATQPTATSESVENATRRPNGNEEVVELLDDSPP